MLHYFWFILFMRNMVLIVYSHQRLISYIYMAFSCYLYYIEGKDFGLPGYYRGAVYCETPAFISYI